MRLTRHPRCGLSQRRPHLPAILYAPANIREADMQGLILLVTFLALALVSVAIAVTVGLVLDNFPHIHDMFSVLGFFGTLVILLPVCWLVALRLTEPRHPAKA
jgi:hypothetical protein